MVQAIEVKAKSIRDENEKNDTAEVKNDTVPRERTSTRCAVSATLFLLLLPFVFIIPYLIIDARVHQIVDDLSEVIGCNEIDILLTFC